MSLKNLTEQEFAALVKRRDRDPIEGVRSKVTGLAAGGVHSVVGKPASSPYRSKLEAAWANQLEILKRIPRRDGGIQGWAYEPLNFRLPGEKNFYKIDFVAWDEHGAVFYEVKGRNKSDDRSLVKMKTAAGLNPWARFVLVKRMNGQWDERSIT